MVEKTGIEAEHTAMRRLRHFVNPILLFAAHSRRADLIRQIQYLKVENEILRKRLPRRLIVTPRERQRLTKYARRVGAAIAHIVSIVKPDTVLAWVRGTNLTWGQPPKKPGRPRTPEHIERVILKIARETGWGYTRILGELRKLGYMAVSRSTEVNILKRHGLDPNPERQKATWDEFIKRHASSLWGCDFLGKRVMTPRGWRCAFVVVFVNVKTRAAWVSPSTQAPTLEWTRQQAEAFLESQQASADPPKLVLHDRDERFEGPFQHALEAHGVTAVRTQIRSPNLNAYAERFIQTLQQECLDHFMFGTRHLDYLLREFLEHYHQERPHQGLVNVPLKRDGPIQPESGGGKIVCRQRLGGLLRHYERRAA